MERQATVFQFDDVLVDLASERILKAGQPMVVEPKAFRVLVHLLENRGRLIEKDELLAAVWPDTFVTENALTREIGLLRKALGDSKADAKYIETVPTRGYRFIATVIARGADASGAGDSAPVGIPLGSSAPASERNHRREFTGKGIVFGSVGLLMVVAVFVVLRFSLEWPTHSKSLHGLLQRPEQVQVTTSSAADIFPSFSPDGSTIAYSSNESAHFEIYLKQLSPGGRVVQLTNDGAENLQPAWSPDGKTIAYYSQIKGGIWLIPALGGVAREITAFGSGPSWSPDGEELVFQSSGIRDLSATSNVAPYSSTLWVSSVRDGSMRQITKAEIPAGVHNAPSWSPDGKNIVFVTSGRDSDEVWTVSPNGKNQRRIATNGSFYNPVFARKDQLIYVAAAMGEGDFGIWTFPLAAKGHEEGGTRILNSLPALSRYLAISPDGHKIAYSNLTTTSNLYSVPIAEATGRAAGPPVALTHDTRFRKTNPNFSADGRRILFDVENVGSDESGIWIMDADGKHPTFATNSCANPSWLRAGRDFACVSWPNPARTEISSVSLETGRSTPIRNLPPDADWLSVSPNGKEVVFHLKKNGALNIWTAPLPEGEPRQLTFDAESAGFPAWSPDSNYLAFETQRGQDTHITVIPSIGGTPVQLTSEPGQSWAHSWSPDGSKIAFAALRNGVWNIRWVSMNGKNQKQVTEYTGSAHFVRYPAWSPLGDQIVYEYGETTGNIWIREIE